MELASRALRFGLPECKSGRRRRQADVHRAPRPCANGPGDEEVLLAEATDVARINFADWTAGNHLRSSRFVALRDKDPREAVHSGGPVAEFALGGAPLSA